MNLVRATLLAAASRTAGLLDSIDDGKATVESAGSGAVDCRLSCEPVNLVFLGYGRIDQWGPIARGRLRAWGRKPWLGPKFTSLFVNP